MAFDNKRNERRSPPENSAAESDELEARKARARATFAAALGSFFFPPDRADFVAPVLELAKELDPCRRSSVDAFAGNLAGAISVAAMPYNMAAAAVRQRAFHAVHSAQRIRSLKPEYSHLSEEERDNWALETAKEQFEKDLREDDIEATKSPPGKFGTAILDDLQTSLRDQTFSESADELLRQCSVLCWGALEVLASDTFVAIVNAKPSTAEPLFRDARTKKWYQGRDLAAVLEEHDYNLSACMGSVLIEQHRIDDVEGIRSVFDVLFPSNSALRGILSDEKLWRLSQDRNLIVHRRGVVDRNYVARTGSDCPVGARLRINPTLFERYLTYVRAAGIEILKAR